MSHHRLTRSAALGLTLAALAAQTAAAKPADMPTAGNDSTVAGTTAPSPRQDLRSPDNRVAVPAVQASQDLRSPDSRDASAGRGTFNAPEVAVIRMSEPSPARAGGIDWGDAGIGAGGVVAAILLGLGSAFAVVHRRRPGGTRTATPA